MSITSIPPNSLLAVGLEQARRNWGWFVGLGLLLVVSGTVALGASVFVTLASMLFFGWILIISGVMQLVQIIAARDWSGTLLHILAGILDLVIGLLIVAHPTATALALTIVLAAGLLIGGTFRMIAAGLIRFPNWGWSLAAGATSVLLGIALFTEFPASGVWFIGFCIGLELVFRGWGWVMFGLAARQIPPAA